jgi:hypothetical protein
VNTVHGDRYGGEWPAQRFQAHGIIYKAAEQTKSDLYRDLLPLVNAARVELLDMPRLHAQLLGLERRTARGGRDSIDHAPGAHDDPRQRGGWRLGRSHWPNRTRAPGVHAARGRTHAGGTGAGGRRHPMPTREQRLAYLDRLEAQVRYRAVAVVGISLGTVT